MASSRSLRSSSRQRNRGRHTAPDSTCKVCGEIFHHEKARKSHLSQKQDEAHAKEREKIAGKQAAVVPTVPSLNPRKRPRAHSSIGGPNLSGWDGGEAMMNPDDDMYSEPGDTVVEDITRRNEGEDDLDLFTTQYSLSTLKEWGFQEEQQLFDVIAPESWQEEENNLGMSVEAMESLEDMEIGEAGPGPSTMLSALVQSYHVPDVFGDERVVDVDEDAGQPLIMFDDYLRTKWQKIFGEKTNATLDDAYTPFASELDWNIAHWAVTEGIKHSSITRLLAIPGVWFLIS